VLVTPGAIETLAESIEIVFEKHKISILEVLAVVSIISEEMNAFVFLLCALSTLYFVLTRITSTNTTVSYSNSWNSAQQCCWTCFATAPISGSR